MINKKDVKNSILVVDDMEVHRDLVFKLLNRAKYTVTLAESGEKAIEILMSDMTFELVLLDVEMPGMNGFEVCKIMRNDKRLKEIPVIFLTSYGKIENKINGFGYGAQDFVTKPFNNRELLVRINTHLLIKHKSDMIRKMNHDLEDKNKNITESIAYARYIQQALLPSLKLLDKLIPERFIYFKSKELIGGDFYWFKQFGSRLYIAVADCTGHGVPGALMSVLGISLLNEVIKDHFYYSPSGILSELRHRILKALHQGSDTFYNKDGMDMAICLIDFESLKLQYAGANIPLFLIRKDETKNIHELIKRVPDRMPIGSHPSQNHIFTNHFIDLLENDRLYLFTDGYTSQFGGELNKTFKTRRLIEMINNFQHLGLKDQKTAIEKKFIEWKNKNDQVDDVLCLGLHIQKSTGKTNNS